MTSAPSRVFGTGALHGRRAAAEDWLLRSARDRETAVAEWTAELGVAVLTAGISWDVVRMPYAVLDGSFGRDVAPGALLHRLEQLELEGAVFCDPFRPYLYVMVPAGTNAQWPRLPALPGVECLGRTGPCVQHVGVPRLDRTKPPGPYWLRPPDRTSGRYADPGRLLKFLRARAAEPDPEPPAPPSAA
ncbi:hypothetical protein [Streptomyces sp. 16-176A]|uniref:hypothetical protein n=1 Tax=Streptomyces sp. 16-176A TaxID=2530458 RepID=UPI00345D6016